MIVLGWVSAFILALTCFSLLIVGRWRIRLGLLAVQYAAVFGLVLAYWPLMMASAKLITGWMALMMLALALAGLPAQAIADPRWRDGRLFRLFAGAVVFVTVTRATPSVADWLPTAGLPVLWGGLTLIGMGLLLLGITMRPFYVIQGLLMTLAGFETLYATVENSVLVAGLLTVITLALALIGSFLLIREAEGIQP